MTLFGVGTRTLSFAAIVRPLSQLMSRSEDALLRQAETEGVTLLKADAVSGYTGVYFNSNCKCRLECQKARRAQLCNRRLATAPDCMSHVLGRTVVKHTTRSLTICTAVDSGRSWRL